MILGFALAAYAIVANDSIQTIGTFMSSNAHRPWWALWIWISGILVVTVTWGWLANGGDPAFGRLAASGKNIPFPGSYGGPFTWLFVLPPLALVILTRIGIPVSTSLLVLTSFKGLVAAQQGEDAKGAIQLFGGMMEKSLVGYAIAFVLGLVIFRFVTGALEKQFFHEPTEKKTKPQPSWMLFQWFSTGFLWSMWLVQDLANIFAYLPRQLTWWGLALSLGGMVLLQGYIFKQKGGKIQKVVTSKTNTLDVRSACFIDLLYGLVLLLFKVDYIPQLFAKMGQEVPWPPNMPMSTTWVFLGLLAGREIGLAFHLKNRNKKQLTRLVFIDAGKAFLGSIIAIIFALLLPLLIVPVVAKGNANPPSDSTPEMPAKTTTEATTEAAVSPEEPLSEPSS